MDTSVAVYTLRKCQTVHLPHSHLSSRLSSRLSRTSSTTSLLSTFSELTKDHEGQEHHSQEQRTEETGETTTGEMTTGEVTKQDVFSFLTGVLVTVSVYEFLGRSWLAVIITASILTGLGVVLQAVLVYCLKYWRTSLSPTSPLSPLSPTSPHANTTRHHAP